MHRWLILALGVATAMLITGCGNASHSPSQSEFPPSAETEETSVSSSAEESEAEPGGPLTNVGTITESDGEGTTFSNHYRVGPLLYSNDGTPPEEVLEACNLINDPTELATSVFMRGQVAITYQEGTLPTEVSLGSVTGPVVQEVNNGEEGSGQLNSLTAFHAGGAWWCTSTSSSIEFQPGETQTLPIWTIVSRVLSNAQPRLPARTLNAWYFEVIGPPLVTGRTVTTHGPGAGLCKEEYSFKEKLLFLYNRSGSCAATAATSSESTTGTEATDATGSEKETQAVLSEVGDSGASGTAIFGRVKNSPLLQVVAEGLEPSPKGQSYTVWVAKSPQKMLSLSSMKVPKSGKIAAQFAVPTEVLAYLATGAFDQIVVTATNEAQLEASLSKATKEQKSPIYTGTAVLRGPITGPITGLKEMK